MAVVRRRSKPQSVESFRTAIHSSVLRTGPAACSLLQRRDGQRTTRRSGKTTIMMMECSLWKQHAEELDKLVFTNAVEHDRVLIVEVMACAAASRLQLVGEVVLRKQLRLGDELVRGELE